MSTAASPLLAFARRFAAKEAFAKALGTGIREPVLFSAMQITHDALGKPQLACTGALQELVCGQALTVHLA